MPHIIIRPWRHWLKAERYADSEEVHCEEFALVMYYYVIKTFQSKFNFDYMAHQENKGLMVKTNEFRASIQNFNK